jgi:hypothetical protein
MDEALLAASPLCVSRDISRFGGRTEDALRCAADVMKSDAESGWFDPD